MERCAVVPYEGEREYLFISYSHRDTALVVPIMEHLASEGYRIWYDEGIDPGSEWPETIADHLGRASACIGFISNNYLASDNCRREMNYALKKQIPYLSVMLEETEMTAGVEMQLSANQAIFKYKLPSEAAFYQKINATKFLQSSREVPAPDPVPEAPAAETPVPETPAPETPVPAPEAPVRGPETPKPVQEKREPMRKRPAPVPETPISGRTPPALKKPAPADGKNGSGKKKRTLKLLLILLAAAIVLSIVLWAALHGSRSGNSHGSGTSAPVSQTTTTLPSNTAQEPASGAPDLSSVDTASPATKAQLLSGNYAGRVMWGQKRVYSFNDEATFIARVRYADVRLEGGSLNISVLPYETEVRAYEHPDVIRLTFIDKLGTKYVVEGKYAIKNGALTVSHCEKTYDDARSLDETLRFNVSLSYDQVFLETEDRSSNLSYRCATPHLNGAAEIGMLGDVESADIPVFAVDASCTIRFSDGGNALDATIGSYYSSLCAFDINWKQEHRPYNGTYGDFSANGNFHIYYINTYPCGFIVFDKDDNAYIYQRNTADNGQ